jgi:hypothetical protein
MYYDDKIGTAITIVWLIRISENFHSRLLDVAPQWKQELNNFFLFLFTPQNFWQAAG